MKVEELSKLTDKEKLLIFNLTVEQAKENKSSFESQIGPVLNAFHICKEDSTKKEEPVKDNFEMNMRPRPEYIQEDFKMDMRPRPEFVQEDFKMNMAPTKKDTDSNYDGPSIERVDIQMEREDNSISV